MSVEAQPTFAATLKALRADAGLTQDALAERAGISKEAVSALERGFRRRPHAATVALIADALALDENARQALQRAATARGASAGVALARAPSRLNRLIGRERDVVAILRAVQPGGLLTIIGPGGVGKSRLATEIAHRLLEIDDGAHVAFVDLVPLERGAAVGPWVASALGITIPAGHEAAEAIAASLRSRPWTIVFDNCEHVADAVATFVSSLRANCPALSVVATSRQPLEFFAETLYRLGPLAVPPADVDVITAQQAWGFSAIDLFCERAAQAGRHLTLPHRDAALVAEICRRLDGMPLAIELAAARLRSMTLADLHQRLDERFAILTTRAADVAPRHRALRATMDWSYDSLSDAERRCLRAAAVFPNGFALDAAAAVCTDGGDELAALELITALTDKSLLQPDFEGDETRYRMLETTRAYAFGHLEALNERDETMRRLLAYLNGVLDKRLPADRESGLDSDLLRFLSTDLSTVTTVLRWACRSRDVADAAQLLRKIDTAWSYVGHAQEGITWVEAVAGMLPVDASRLRARLRTTLAFLYCNEARTQEGDLAATAAVESARSCGDAPTLLSALRARTVTLCSLGRHRDAEDALEEAEALAGPHPPRFVRRTLLNARGVLASARGEPAAAVEAFRANVEIARGLGDPYEVMREVAFLAEALHAAGDTGSAIRETEAALYSAQTTLQMDAPAIVLANLAGYMLALDDVERGAQTATRALKTAMRPSGTQTELAAASLQLALACALSGDFASAARLFGFSVAAKDPIGSDTSHTEALTTDRLKGILRARFGDATLQSLTAEGSHFTERRVSELMP